MRSEIFLKNSDVIFNIFANSLWLKMFEKFHKKAQRLI